ncbi:hypothetical protein B0A49_01057 [Cryomyces minteri]|uniref:Ecp2 effector protein domain-containing protein n=1 Tax=Cryomyces minteri TaxID=331657 RepID=A0A4U0XW49_9PEZI|nr:hypothetical protein B0A49_01057 [Cryomyces minteri]
MVQIAVIFAAVVPLFSLASGREHLTANFAGYAEVNCGGVAKPQMVHMKLNKCYDMNDFASYRTYTEGHKHHNKPVIGEKNCTLTAFALKHCEGDHTVQDEIKTAVGTCWNALGGKQALSARFTCISPPSAKDLKKEADAKKKEAESDSDSDSDDDYNHFVDAIAEGVAARLVNRTVSDAE